MDVTIPSSDVIRIYGVARNLGRTPPPIAGEEVWLANWHKGYNIRLPRALKEWTRYFNLHSRKHMDETYPSGVAWYKKQDTSRPIYFQKHQPDIPASVEFPRKEIEAAFPEAMGPKGHFYSTCSVSWLLAFAILQKPKRIELWGFALADNKGPEKNSYTWERPCFFYWVQKARDLGIEVTYPQEIQILPFVAGDPKKHFGPVYGFDTKPEGK